MAGNGGRTGGRYRAICRDLRASGRPCWICHGPIDTRRPEDGGPPFRSRWSFSVDHLTPLHAGGDPLDPTNCTSAHYGCNSRRGNLTRSTPEPRSRNWLVAPD